MNTSSATSSATPTVKKYTFTTVVVPEAIRAQFTEKRDELKSTDKELFSAIWETADWTAVVANVEAKQAAALAEKEQAKAHRDELKAKLREQLKAAKFVTTKPEVVEPEAPTEPEAPEAPTEEAAAADEVPADAPAAEPTAAKRKPAKRKK